MRYYIVPVNNGVLDIDYRDLQEGIHTNADTCHVRLRDGAEVRESWTEITEAEFLQAKVDMGLIEIPE